MFGQIKKWNELNIGAFFPQWRIPVLQIEVTFIEKVNLVKI